jgi:iron complex outermembrane recepter protein
LLFVPSARTLDLANIFAEDHIRLDDTVQLIVGLKLEDDPYSGITPMPSVRLSWKPDGDTLLWGAVSRVIRAPTPFDTDVQEKLGTVTFLDGDPDFLPEQVTAYELGYRGQITPRLSLSVSGFENVYDDLKDIELGTVSVLRWGNGIQGDVHGMEAWATFQAASWWRLSASLDLQHDDLKFAPGSADLIGVSQAGDDPHHQASLRSTMSLPDDLSFEADFRDVGELPNPIVPEYVELNSRLNWHASDTLDFSLSGFNLLHAQHQEFSPGDEIPRSVNIETRYRF